MLGDASYRVVVTTRGGSTVIGEFDPRIVTSLRWERKLDDVSDAEVVLSVSSDGNCDCCSILRDVDPIATELLIIRNNIPVWVGPITVIEITRSTATIFAKDLSAWFDWRVVHQDHRYPPSGYFGADKVNLVGYALELVNDALLPDNPNIVVQGTLGEVEGSRDVRAKDYRITQDELAETLRTDVDMVIHGRNITLFGTEVPKEYIPELSDEDFLTDLRIRRDGLKMATRVIVNGNESLWGIYPADPDGDAVYGLKERIFNETGILDQVSLDQAAKSRYDLFRTPVTTLEIPNNAQLSRTAPVTIQDLIPGFRQRITVRHMCVPISAVFRLMTVNVEFSKQQETVSCSWGPLGTVIE